MVTHDEAVIAHLKSENTALRRQLELTRGSLAGVGDQIRAVDLGTLLARGNPDSAQLGLTIAARIADKIAEELPSYV